MPQRSNQSALNSFKINTNSLEEQAIANQKNSEDVANQHIEYSKMGGGKNQKGGNGLCGKSIVTPTASTSQQDLVFKQMAEMTCQEEANSRFDLKGGKKRRKRKKTRKTKKGRKSRKSKKSRKGKKTRKYKRKRKR
jgi:hypothetical protein